MIPVSVVIICRNNAGVLEKTLMSLKDLTDDILVYDNGSTDGSPETAQKNGAKVVLGEWLGFGPTKNAANRLAKYDWILSLDADEAIDELLKAELKNIDYRQNGVVYDLKFKNYVGEKWLRFGDWGSDHHIRLFNRTEVQWNDAKVHEELIIPAGTRIEKPAGAVLHRTTDSASAYKQKLRHYARLSANKYFEKGKKAGWVKLYLSPVFSFIRDYIFKLGILDGVTGFQIAWLTAWYTGLKYRELDRMRTTGNE